MNRTFKKLRVSLTPECNFSCLYCVGTDELSPQKKAHNSSIQPLERIIDQIRAIHSHVQLHAVRLTGGEPLLHPSVVEIVKELQLMGIPKVQLTTNGSKLSHLAYDLQSAGLSSVNISLDAISPTTFISMSRHAELKQVLDGVDVAMAAGLEVKLNAVIMKGKNDDQILPLLEYAFSKNIVIRFLELMKMGPLHTNYLQWLFTQNEILQKIQTAYQITPLLRLANSTANYWKVSQNQVFGIIANESEPFCEDCNRLRLDSRGRIYGCIAAQNGIQLEHKPQINLSEKLAFALNQKQDIQFVGHNRSMQFIGG